MAEIAPVKDDIHVSVNIGDTNHNLLNWFENNQDLLFPFPTPDHSIKRNLFHCILNRFDSRKDAKATKKDVYEQISPDDNNFNNVMNDLYRCSVPPKLNLKPLEDSVFSLPTAQTNKVTIAGISDKFKNLDFNRSFVLNQFRAGNPEYKIEISYELSDEFKYAIVDAAVNPTKFNESVQVIHTAAHSLDPATRCLANTVWPQTNIPLFIDLENFGFSGINMTCTFNDDSGNDCHIVIRKDQAVLVDVRIDKEGEIISSVAHPLSPDANPPGYFKGNPTKNRYFNSAAAGQTHLNDLMYVLGKELGDTLQVIIGAIMINFTSGLYTPRNLVAYTNDIPFACRSIVLGLPVLLKNAINIFDEEGPTHMLRSFTFYYAATLTPEEITNQSNTNKIKEIITHNNGVKNRLAEFKREPDAVRTIAFSTNFRTTVDTIIETYVFPLFTEIIDYIDKINEFLTMILPRNDILAINSNEFKNFFEKFRAFQVVDVSRHKKGNKSIYALNSLLTRVCSEFTTSDAGLAILENVGIQNPQDLFNKDPIFARINETNNPNVATIGQYIRQITISRSSRNRSGGNSNKNQRGGYNEAQDMLDMNDILDHFSLACFDIFYNYFKYVGETYINDEFLFKWISIFLGDKGQTILPSCSEFESVMKAEISIIKGQNDFYQEVIEVYERYQEAAGAAAKAINAPAFVEEQIELAIQSGASENQVRAEADAYIQNAQAAAEAAAEASQETAAAYNIKYPQDPVDDRLVAEAQQNILRQKHQAEIEEEIEAIEDARSGPEYLTTQLSNRIRHVLKTRVLSEENIAQFALNYNVSFFTIDIIIDYDKIIFPEYPNPNVFNMQHFIIPPEYMNLLHNEYLDKGQKKSVKSHATGQKHRRHTKSKSKSKTPKVSTTKTIGKTSRTNNNNNNNNTVQTASKKRQINFEEYLHQIPTPYSSIKTTVRGGRKKHRTTKKRRTTRKNRKNKLKKGNKKYTRKNRKNKLKKGNKKYTRKYKI
jgi:hypothetical protein